MNDVANNIIIFYLRGIKWLYWLLSQLTAFHFAEKAYFMADCIIFYNDGR